MRLEIYLLSQKKKGARKSPSELQERRSRCRQRGKFQGRPWEGMGQPRKAMFSPAVNPGK
jgi:hypothetical protein